ncbi:MAG: sigma-70 family RNA polymerase sigma factor [Tepidisphaeraceae bacterium]|jgi:RNA polymerase sigma factor (sigma-70 family)
MDEDRRLLREFVEMRSQTAFESLVRRHADMVYAVARRGIDDAHLAEDVTQAVFLLLARKADQLGERVVIAGWLFQVARLATADARKKLSRQRRRQAAIMIGATHKSAQHDFDPMDWERISPVLNDAVARLNGADRAVVVLRFFEDRNHEEIGAALGISEEAARMRLSRALGKLRKKLASAGEGTGLAELLQAKAPMPAPPGLAIAAVASVLGRASASVHAIAQSVSRMMLMLKMKAAGVVVGILLLMAAVGATAIYHGKPRLQAVVSPASPPPVVAISTTLPSINLDLSTPQAAVISYLQAVRNRDLNGQLAAAVYTPDVRRLLVASLEMDRAYDAIVDAAIKRFGAAAVGKTERDLPDTFIGMVKSLTVHINGNTAEFGDHGDWPCRRVGNQWRYDLVTLHQRDGVPIETNIKFCHAVTEFFKSVVPRIVSGEWSTYEDLEVWINDNGPKPPIPATVP